MSTYRCLTPYSTVNPNYPVYSSRKSIAVPCGKCPPCRKRRAAQWSFRLMQFEKRAANAAFLTLTYDNDHVPLSVNNLMTLVPAHLQAFWKRVRKDNLQKLKYYAVGEYGGRTQRPHYHAIVFNFDSIDLFQKHWHFGFVDHGSCQGPSIQYVTNYVDKPRVVPAFARDDRVPEFSRMSKFLGVEYLSDAMIAWHKADLRRSFVVMPDGYRVPLPRYFKEKIYSEEERRKIALANEYLPDKWLDMDPKELHERIAAIICNYERSSKLKRTKV